MNFLTTGGAGAGEGRGQGVPCWVEGGCQGVSCRWPLLIRPQPRIRGQEQQVNTEYWPLIGPHICNTELWLVAAAARGVGSWPVSALQTCRRASPCRGYSRSSRWAFKYFCEDSNIFCEDLNIFVKKSCVRLVQCPCLTSFSNLLHHILFRQNEKCPTKITLL